MSYAPQNTRPLSMPYGRGLPALAAQLAGVLSASLASARDRRLVAGLSDRQLRDAGIDPSAILGDTPSVEVKAGLMSYLMSLR